MTSAAGTALRPSLKANTRTFLWRDAADVVRRAIISGELQAGDQISGPQIAQQLNVSLAPARDAIRTLVHEGLLEQRDGITLVRGGSEADLEQLYDARLMI